MNLIVSIIEGGIIGWLAALALGRREGIVGSVVIGIVGSIIGGILSSLVGGGDYLLFSWPGVLWSFVGAIILVAILNGTQYRTHSVQMH